MSILRSIAKLVGRERPTPTSINAKYDAARTTTDNSNHWANADGLSANAAASAAVREKIRRRARYECHESNAWAKGITQTLANDMVGTGPRLQLVIDTVSAQSMSTNTLASSNRWLQRVERLFNEWATEIGLAAKLRTMRMAKAVDGEAFAVFTTNPALRSPIKLDIQLIDADRVASPNTSLPNARYVDGIRFDEHGNPESYDILTDHPGTDQGTISSGQTYQTVPASQVIHWYRQDRPGQDRGVSEFAAALPLFGQLRRYRAAVMAAAETAADLAGVIRTNTASVDPASLVAGDSVNIEQRMLLTLPEGWDISQMKAEQPTTTYEQFSDNNLNEAGRCVSMPLNVAKGNSQKHNYASGRLDHQQHHKAIVIERSGCESSVLSRIFYVFELEARQEMTLPETLDRKSWSVSWFWDGFEHVDPLKEAKAESEKLNNHTTTLAEVYARKGKDWREAIEQRGREVALLRELKLPVPSDAHQQIDDADPDDVAENARQEDEE
jgi:lambda family phage portal protein